MKSFIREVLKQASKDELVALAVSAANEIGPRLIKRVMPDEPKEEQNKDADDE